MDIQAQKFRDDEFWRVIPTWEGVDYETFVDDKWQEKNAVTSFKKLIKIVEHYRGTPNHKH